jgi:cytochrome bd-type quinol oxidase subunit 1
MTNLTTGLVVLTAVAVSFAVGIATGVLLAFIFSPPAYPITPHRDD